MTFSVNFTIIDIESKDIMDCFYCYCYICYICSRFFFRKLNSGEFFFIGRGMCYKRTGLSLICVVNFIKIM